MRVYEKARELVEALKQEEIYSEFVKWQGQVFAAPRLKETLLALRRHEFELHRQQLKGKDASEEEKDNLRRLYETARQDDVINRYLDAEYRFSRMMLDIQKIINDAVPVKRPEN
ncbi:MAG: YlbF family regulator [Eubacteriales bacterium]|nr:YlbF family regulator [Eubacteriales bacterium]